MKNYHSVLEVPATATQEEIKLQYRQMVRIYHPDRFTNPVDKLYAEEKFKEINEAYRALATTANSNPATEPNGAPQPTVDPLWVDFGVVDARAKAVRSFIVNNLGAPTHHLDFVYMEQPWFKVINGRPVTANQPLPLLFDLIPDVRQLAPDHTHHGWVDVEMDGVRTRLNLSLRVAGTKLTPHRWRLAATAAMAVLLLTTMVALQLSGRMAVLTRALRPLTSVAATPRLAADQLLFAVAENDQYRLYLSQPSRAALLPLGIAGRSPALAARGGQVAYVADVKAIPQIFLADADGRHARQLSNDDMPKAAPAWSPDARMLAFLVGTDTQ
ncbi:MAG: DnaJ domain-containing protein [Chloroflexota bacterium]|nr:DnaJ domain-containing protein [Chloroflexota bacterium]